MELTSVTTLVREMGVSIAEAQWRLDETSIRIAKMLGSDDSAVEIAGKAYSLLELGFTPTFYQLTEATVEAKVSFSTSTSTGFDVGASVAGGCAFFAASVSASYSQKYSYSASGSSSITAKFVSIPPPAVLTRMLSNNNSPTTPE